MVSLLPPNATPLERALEHALAPGLDAEADSPRLLKMRRPDPVLPWLAAEWRLAEFAPYFPDLRSLIDAGLPWLHERGTAAAVTRALAWIDLDAALEEEMRLQIDPGAVLPPEQLPAVRQLVGASIPAHVQFYRLYHGYDLRPLRLDSSQLDDALLDNDSGVWVDGVKVSFGTHHRAVLDEPDEIAVGGMTRQYSTRVWDDNSWRLDNWRLDSEVLIDAASGQISQHSAVLPEDTELPIIHGLRATAVAILDIEADASLAAYRTEGRAGMTADEVRGWHGPWQGHWREPIPSRTTFESL